MRTEFFPRMRVFLAVASVAFMSACTTHTDEDANDPIEPVNRAVHGFNKAVDTVVIRPVAWTYREVIPDPVQERIGNGLRNLKSPVILANDLVQGEFDNAWVTFMRLLINSTWGLAGLHDVAGEMGFTYHNEDFGQTLAVAGVEEGPYLVLPILGPSNPRDTVGLVVDWIMDPFRLYTAAKNVEEANYVRTGLQLIDTRAGLIDVLDDVEKTSLDTYVSYRTLYRQRRAAEIKNQTLGHEVDGEAFDFNDTPEQSTPAPLHPSKIGM